MTSDIIRKQIRAGEGPATVFKEDARNVDAIAAAVCGFLNTKGGVVFVGVDPQGRVVGIHGDPEQVRRDLELRLQKAISPKALFTVSVDEDDEGRALVTIETPAGRDRPYVVDGRTYVRRGKTTRAADATELRSLIQDRSVESERWERRPALGLEIDDLDEEEIRRTTQQAERLDRWPSVAAAQPFDVLQQLGMANASGLTQGCDVAFGRDPALRLPQCRLRYIRFATDKVGDTYEDNQWIQGPIFQVFERVFERLTAQVQVQATFQEGNAQRQDRPNYSLDALREGLVNALAHRDYASFSGGVSVSVFPRRIEIWNTGRLPAEIEVRDLRNNHPSIPTNPDITHVLYLRNLMERTGRGTLKIISGCKALGARPPRWDDRPSGVTLTLYAATEGQPEEFVLNARQSALVSRLRPGDSIRVHQYVEELQGAVTERQARRDLAQLEAMGLMVRSGQARATTYRRTEVAL